MSNHVLSLAAAAYLACADPNTEAVRGYELTSGSGTVVSVGRRLFLGGAHGVTVVRPPSACFR